MKRILILGGARFHGFLLAERLASRGHDVCVLNRGRFRAQFGGGIEHLRADRTNVQAIRQALAGKRFDAVVDNNGYLGTHVELMLGSLPTRVTQYVFVSSAAIYRRLESYAGLVEADDCAPPDPRFDPAITPYAHGKRECEQVLQRMCADQATIVRLPNVFGAGDFAGKIQQFRARLGDGSGIPIEEEVRQFSLICVDDVVTVLVQIIEEELFRGETINVAHPTPLTPEGFFLSLFGEKALERLRRFPASELRAAECTLPFAWGPTLSVDRALRYLRGAWTPIVEWGATAERWERECAPSLPTSFLSLRAREIAFLKGSRHV